MSAEGAKAFYERVTSDENFRAQVEAQETWEDKQRVVTGAGYDVTSDDLPTIRKLRRELADEDLESASGGASGGIAAFDSGTFPDLDDPGGQYTSTSNA